MEQKLLLHASSWPDINITVKFLRVLQKTRALRTVSSAPCCGKSLTIDVHKETMTPVALVRNPIVI